MNRVAPLALMLLPLAVAAYAQTSPTPPVAGRAKPAPAKAAPAEVAAPVAPVAPNAPNAPAVATAAPACDATCIRGSADRAVQSCAPRIEAEAPGDYEWLMRPYGSLFQEADMPEQPSSAVVRYRGDSIRFLSPQKEWVRAIYECGFDAARQQVAYVRVRLGVLGKVNAVPVLPGQQAQARAPQAAPAQPTPMAQTNAAAPPAAAAATSDRRRVGEPNEVSVLQVKSAVAR